MGAIPNPYSNQDLFVGAAVSERLSDLVSRSEKDGAKPFTRQIDAWWLAMGIGVRLQRRTPLPDKPVKFNDGGILATEPWRITQLELIALAQEETESLDNPSKIIKMASEYANAGFEWMLDALVGQSQPTLTLVNRISEITDSESIVSDYLGEISQGIF